MTLLKGYNSNRDYKKELTDALFPEEAVKYDCDDCKYYPCVLQVCFGMEKKKPLGLCGDKLKMEKEEKSLDYHLNRIKELNEEANRISGALTCKVMLRQLNCEHNRGMVTLSVNELLSWFERGQHLREWKEIDTL